MKNYKIAGVNRGGTSHEGVPRVVEVLKTASSKFGFEFNLKSFPCGA
jgi:hypothetical protein